MASVKDGGYDTSATSHGAGAGCVQGKGGTYIVIPRVVKPEYNQNKHGPDGKEAAGKAHRIKITKERASEGGPASRREERFLGCFEKTRHPREVSTPI